mgnify:CR=1 FL=1
MIDQNKIRIGIVAGRSIKEPNRPFLDTTNFVNNFVKRLDEVGAIPFGIVFPDGVFKEEYLDIYDGFFFHSGPHVWPHQLATLHYAITHNKPVLGICLGEQVLGTYAYVIDQLKKQEITPTYETIIAYFTPIMEKEDLFLSKVEGHDPESTFYTDSIPKAQQQVYLKEGTILYDIYQKPIINQPSLHNWVVKNSGLDFVASAFSPEGYIEALEYKDSNYFILGVQFHAELEDKNNILFQRFIQEVQKRK